MKKVRKLCKQKLNTIVQSNYVVIDLDLYNSMITSGSRYSERFDKIYRVIYSDESPTKKFNKIKDIMLGK